MWWLPLWRVWKWLIHLLTGHCEIYRLCMSNASISYKITAIVISLKLSRKKSLNTVAAKLGLGLNAATATDIVVREKCIKPLLQPVFRVQLSSCLSMVSGVRELWLQIEDLRAEQYDQNNERHEEALSKLWANLMSGEDLEARISKQWQEIGFQGNNPATDFRGMGMLGLNCLLYFSDEHRDRARSLLLHSKHPQYWYPFAVVGIDLTGVLYDWLKDGHLDYYMYSQCKDWPPPTSVFMELFCVTFCQFDSFWLSEKPENIMAFPKVKADFLKHFEHDLAKGTAHTL